MEVLEGVGRGCCEAREDYSSNYNIAVLLGHHPQDAIHFSCSLSLLVSHLQSCRASVISVFIVAFIKTLPLLTRCVIALIPHKVRHEFLFFKKLNDFRVRTCIPFR